ncbi:radical SAM protein [Gemmata sp. G18]|uniref:Radical SAM protein n=1 Tax=Gemmata palustris TaxID=2822762 RepID=A0ABS5BNT3_9BACT|nr:radical SAM protein [Gemmata palustris]MBP3955337.1 radical SAM protein [Gemmata palustris]
MGDVPLAFVSAGLTQPKKGGNAFASYNLYLNYGLLGLASMVARCGRTVSVHHGRFDLPEDVCDRLTAAGMARDDSPVFLSIPSVFALPWAARFCRKLKQNNPDARIVAGGRWVMDEDGAWVRSKIPELDLCVYGTAEERIIDLLSPRNWPFIPYTDASPGKLSAARPAFPALDYRLMPDYEDFHPSLEVSRGCGMGCSFCLEASVPLSDMRPAAEVVTALRSYDDLYARGQFGTYFEASFFRPPSPWIIDFCEAYAQAGLRCRWRCETRVDSLTPAGLSALAGAGLKVVDLGLESASRIQLQRMGKTHLPEVYLRRASALLRECKASGVWAKVNVLLYAGETHDTLRETLDWLSSHSQYIKGVSVNPLVVYGRSPSAQSYLTSLEEYGATPVDHEALGRDGYAHMHLSPSIDYAASEALVGHISKMFMSDRDYYDLKYFCYFPRWMDYGHFSRIAAACAPDQLPFSTTGREDSIYVGPAA